MKIAIESNDGVTLKSPFSQTKGYIVCDIEDEGIEKSQYVEVRSTVSKINRKVQSGFRLNDCTSVITRGMDNENQNMLRENGIEVFVTFNTLAKDALRSYLKEKMINELV